MMLFAQPHPLKASVHSCSPLNAPLEIAQIFGNAVQVHESTMQNGHVSCPFPATAIASIQPQPFRQRFAKFLKIIN